MFSLISLWHKEQLTPAELHFEETKTSKPQPKNKNPINIKRGQVLSFLLCSMVFSTTQKFFLQKKKKSWNETEYGDESWRKSTWFDSVMEEKVKRRRRRRRSGWVLKLDSISDWVWDWDWALYKNNWKTFGSHEYI